MPFTVPSGTDLYDALMFGIEPDLVTVRLPLLEQKYRGESPEEHAARMERYQRAYEEYDRKALEWMAKFRMLVTAYRKEALSRAESREQSKEATLLADIESQLSHSS